MIYGIKQLLEAYDARQQSKTLASLSDCADDREFKEHHVKFSIESLQSESRNVHEEGHSVFVDNGGGSSKFIFIACLIDPTRQLAVIVPDEQARVVFGMEHKRHWRSARFAIRIAHGMGKYNPSG